MNKVLVIGLTPAVQELREFKKFAVGEVNRSFAIHRSAAGKGVNVARVLRQLGGAPVLLGFVGGSTGKVLCAMLRAEDVTERMVRLDAPTRVCTTIKDHATCDVTELVEEAALPGRADWQKFFRSVHTGLRTARYVVIAGALMPGASPKVYRDIARTGKPLIIDSQREPLLVTLPHRPLIAKLNVHELENTLGPEIEPVAGARELIRRGAQNVVLTNGAAGAWLVTPESVWHYRPPRLNPVNPIGSGDAVTAGIADALTRGASLADATRYGIACGSANALTLIAGNVRLPDVKRLLKTVRARPV